MSEYIVRLPTSGAADEFIRKMGVDDCRIYGYQITGEIVRCADCDLSHEDELGNLRCHGPLVEPWDYYNDEPSDGAKVEPSGFCKWGEPKEGSE